MQLGDSSALTHANTSTQGPGATAFSYVTTAVIQTASHRVEVDGAESESTYACVNGSPVGSASSQVQALSIDGAPVSLSSPSAGGTFQVGKDGYVQVNRTSSDAHSTSRLAAFVHLDAVGDFTIALATTSQNSNPCGKRQTSDAVPACPLGSDYSQTGRDCLIADATAKPIVVAAVFQGPTASRVLSPAAAAAAFKSPCLRGPGARFVTVPIVNAGPVIGTGGPDRIISLGGNFSIDSGSGRDCIDTGGGNVSVTAGNGRDRVFLGAGNDRVKLGNGRDLVQGGSGMQTIKLGNGNDVVKDGVGIQRVTLGSGRDYVKAAPGAATITIGNGKDTVLAALGYDRITVGNGNDEIFGAPGFDVIKAGKGNATIFTSLGVSRVTAGGGGAHVSCNVAGRGSVVVTGPAIVYARAHGCKNVA